MLVRLQKYLAEAGVASRRRCEELIEAGQVSVNGQPSRVLGTKIDPERDSVTVGGKRVAIERKVYILLHKPAGCVCTNSDTHGRKRAVDLLPRSLPRLYTVGRLDQDSEGLLFLTNDGTFSLRLTHPRYKMRKTYFVEVEGELKKAEIARLLKGSGVTASCCAPRKSSRCARRVMTRRCGWFSAKERNDKFAG